MTEEQKTQLAMLDENRKALRVKAFDANAEYIAALPIGSLQANGKHRKALVQSIADQTSRKSVGLNEEFRLPAIDDGWTQKQIDSLNTSLENAKAKRTKLLTSKKDEIAKDIAKKETVIERWKIDKPLNDGLVRKHVTYTN